MINPFPALTKRSKIDLKNLEILEVSEVTMKNDSTFFQNFKHPYPSPTGINIVLPTFASSKETKCPCKRSHFTKLTFLRPNCHTISVIQDRDRVGMKKKRQEDEYTRKSENTK